jgi:hypothetical protein
MYTVHIPIVGDISAPSTDELGGLAWLTTHGDNPTGMSYGASEVGSIWPVFRGARRIGSLSYNGRFFPQEAQV